MEMTVYEATFLQLLNAYSKVFPVKQTILTVTSLCQLSIASGRKCLINI